MRDLTQRNMQSNYEKLRGRINEILPDRLELKFGCFIRRFHNAQPDMLLKIAVGTSEHSVYLASGRDGMPLELHGLSTQDIEAFEILGQHITVADVLMALTLHKPLILWTVRPYYPASVQLEFSGKLVATFNLALPLSHPDNDEACGKVLDLITKQDSV